MTERGRRGMIPLGFLLLVTACGDGSSQPGSTGSNEVQLFVTGKPSAVLIEVIGPGVQSIKGSAEYTQSTLRGDTLSVLFAGSLLNGSLGTVTLDRSTNSSLLKVRVVEAADASNQPMPPSAVSANIQGGGT